MANDEIGAEHVHVASGDLVSDVIQGLRSGCVETFRSYVNNGTDVADGRRVFPNIRRVQIAANPTEMIQNDAERVTQSDGEGSFDNESEFMSYLNTFVVFMLVYP